MASRKKDAPAQAAQATLFGPKVEAPLATVPSVPVAAPVASSEGITKLKTGFGSAKRRAFASSAGKQGREVLTARINAQREANERAGVKAPLWSGGFKKGDARTSAIAKYAIQERWRKFYEKRAQELEAQRGKYDAAEIDAVLKKVQEAREFRATEGKDLAQKKYEEQQKYISGMEKKLKSIQSDLEKIGLKSPTEISLPLPKAKAPAAPKPAAAAAAPAAAAPAAAKPAAAAPAAAKPAAKRASSAERQEMAEFQAENLRRLREGLSTFETIADWRKARDSGALAETSVGSWLFDRAIRKSSLGLSTLAFSYVAGRYGTPSVPIDGVAAGVLELVHLTVDQVSPGAFAGKTSLAFEGLSGGALASYLARVGRLWGATGKLSGLV